MPTPARCRGRLRRRTRSQHPRATRRPRRVGRAPRASLLPSRSPLAARRGTAGAAGEVVLAAAADVLGDGRERRLGRRRGADHGRVRGRFTTATATSRSATARADRRGRASPRAAGASVPGASHRARPGRPPGSFGIDEPRRAASASSGTSRRATSRARSRSATGSRGLAVAYDDVVDVNLKVWGDEWKQPLGRLTATVGRPRRRSSAPGAIPSGCAATSRSTGGTALLRALDVPAGQFVELRTLYPAQRVHVDRGHAGAGRQRPRRRSSPRRRPTPPRYERDQERIDDAKRHPRADGPHPPRARHAARALAHRRRSSSGVYGRELRDRATTASTSRSRRPRPSRRSCPTLLRPGRRARLVRVHGDAVRPDPPRPLHGDARDDRASVVGRTPHRADRRPRALARRARSPLTPWESTVADVVDARARRRGRSGCRASASEIEDDRETMSKRFTGFKARGRHGDRRPRLVPLDRRRPARARASLVFFGVAALLMWRRDRRLAAGRRRAGATSCWSRSRSRPR